MKNYIMGLLCGLMLIISGCGSQEAIDVYSFGHKVIDVGQSEVIVASPFEFGQLKTSPVNKKGQPISVYAGLDANYGIYVSALQSSVGAPLPTLDQGAKDSRDSFLKESGLSGQSVDWKVENVQIDGIPAILSTSRVHDLGTNISFTQYTFINRGVLWNIRYSYNERTPMGVQINDRVNGKIQITKKEG